MFLSTKYPNTLLVSLRTVHMPMEREKSQGIWQIHHGPELKTHTVRHLVSFHVRNMQFLNILFKLIFGFLYCNIVKFDSYRF